MVLSYSSSWEFPPLECQLWKPGDGLRPNHAKGWSHLAQFKILKWRPVSVSISFDKNNEKNTVCTRRHKVHSSLELFSILAKVEVAAAHGNLRVEFRILPRFDDFGPYWGYQFWGGRSQRWSVILITPYPGYILSTWLISADVDLDHLAEKNILVVYSFWAIMEVTDFQFVQLFLLRMRVMTSQLFPETGSENFYFLLFTILHNIFLHLLLRSIRPC